MQPGNRSLLCAVPRAAPDIKAKRKLPLDMSPPPEVQHASQDFIVVNALDTIRAKPKAVNVEEPRYVCKREYGQIPKYLTEAKLKIQNEKQAKESAEALRIRQVCHSRLMWHKGRFLGPLWPRLGG